MQVFNSELREKKNEVCLILGPALSPTYSSGTSQASLGCSVLLLSCQSQSLLPGTLAFSHGTYYNQGFRFRFCYAFFKKKLYTIFFHEMFLTTSHSLYYIYQNENNEHYKTFR